MRRIGEVMNVTTRELSGWFLDLVDSVQSGTSSEKLSSLDPDTLAARANREGLADPDLRALLRFLATREHSTRQLRRLATRFSTDQLLIGGSLRGQSLSQSDIEAMFWLDYLAANGDLSVAQAALLKTFYRDHQTTQPEILEAFHAAYLMMAQFGVQAYGATEMPLQLVQRILQGVEEQVLPPTRATALRHILRNMPTFDRMRILDDGKAGFAVLHTGESRQFFAHIFSPDEMSLRKQVMASVAASRAVLSHVRPDGDIQVVGRLDITVESSCYTGDELTRAAFPEGTTQQSDLTWDMHFSGHDTGPLGPLNAGAAALAFPTIR